VAERWQQWMPHDIDAWQGSANVQALSDLAYRAVHNLLQDMWKQPDCALPAEDRELAKRSRIASRWSECKEEVMDYFSDRTESGRLTHRVLLRKWNEARGVYEKRQAAANRTNALRSNHGDRDGDRNAPPTHEQVQEQKQVQEQVQKQKPSAAPRGVRVPDPRHGEFREAFEKYFLHRNHLEAPWDAQEAANLARFLKKNPNFTTEQWRSLLQNRARSDVAHAENLSTWIARALTWANEPTKKGNHGKPTETALIDSRAGYLERRERRMAAELDNQGGLTETGLSRAERPGLGPPAAPVLEGRR